jgi:hypothetical protein
MPDVQGDGFSVSLMRQADFTSSPLTLETTMNDMKQSNSSLTNTLGLLVAASTTAAIVLMSTGEFEQRRPLATDANEQRGGPASIEAAPVALPPNVSYDDPELMRLDRANEHHG